MINSQKAVHKNSQIYMNIGICQCLLLLNTVKEHVFMCVDLSCELQDVEDCWFGQVDLEYFQLYFAIGFAAVLLC